MKKIVSLILTLSLVLTLLAGCADKDTPASDDQVTDITALDALNAAWNGMSEDMRFPAAGGNGDHINMDGPGAFDISDAAAVDASLGLPEAQIASIDDAVSLMHMMNANTFTAGAYHLTESADVDAVAKSIEDNLSQRHWMCGFPEKLVILSVGNRTIVSVFGAGDLIAPFVESLQSAEGSAAVLVDKSLDF